MQVAGGAAMGGSRNHMQTSGAYQGLPAVHAGESAHPGEKCCIVKGDRVVDIRCRSQLFPHTECNHGLQLCQRSFQWTLHTLGGVLCISEPQEFEKLLDSKSCTLGSGQQAFLAGSCCCPHLSAAASVTLSFRAQLLVPLLMLLLLLRPKMMTAVTGS